MNDSIQNLYSLFNPNRPVSHADSDLYVNLDAARGGERLSLDFRRRRLRFVAGPIAGVEHLLAVLIGARDEYYSYG